MKKFSITFLLLMLSVGPSATNSFATRVGGTFNFIAPYGGDFGSLDAHRNNRVQAKQILLNVNRSLYKWGPEGKPVPALAERIDVSQDGLIYTYHLRKGVKFHNGREMNAEDVIWSYNRIMDPDTASNSSRRILMIKGAKEVQDGKAKKISGLRNIDDYTVEITLQRPIEPGYNLFDPGTAILPREEVEQKGDAFGSEPVGCGPFQFAKMIRGSEITLKKFPDYYELGKPYLDKAVYKIMVEDGPRDMAFKAEELDATLIGPTHYPQYKSDPQTSKHMVEVDEMYTIVTGFNLDFEPFKSKLVRHAINYAIDSDLILKKLLKGKGSLAVGFLSTSHTAFDPTAKRYEYNVEKAKALMKAAGYEKGFTVQCIGTANKSWGIPVVEAMIPYLKKISIQIKPQQMEGAAMTAKLNKGDYEMFIWALSNGPDPIIGLERWHSRTPRYAGNYVGYSNSDFDALLDEARREMNEAKRIALLRKADKILFEDAPMWFFAYNGAALAYQPWVHGLQPVPVEMMYQDLADVWVDESSPRAHSK